MTIDVLEKLGVIAGIGGISVGVFFLLFRDVIRKKIFASLTKQQSYRIVQTILILAWSIAVLGIASFVYLQNRDPGLVPTTFIDPESGASYAMTDAGGIEKGCCGFWEIRNAEIDSSLKQNMLDILNLVRSEEYQKASAELSRLPDAEEISRRFKTDLKTAILFGEGKFEEALKSVLDRYEGLPLGDIRYRWEVAYVTYFFRRAQGIQAVEQSIARLKETYRRPDLSYVWMAIQPKAHERLIEQDLYPYQSLREEQLGILRYVVETYPDDRFIDHALYFLKDYDRIISEYPDSLIIDRAYYSRAYLPYHERVVSKKNGFWSDRDLDEIDSKYREFLARFPDNNLHDKALAELAALQTHRNNPDVAFTALLELAAEFPDSPAIVATIQRFFRELDPAIAESHLLKVAEHPELPIDRMRRDLALAYFEQQNYRKSWQYYSMVVDKLEMGEGERQRVKAISIAASAPSIELLDKDQLLEIALEFKKMRNRSEFALPFLDRYIQLARNDNEVAKGLMLQAFSYRRAGMRDEMIEKFQTVVRNYPRSSLADDALAELGTAYLLWGRGDPNKALEYFSLVLDRYPNSNAVDNSYNWIAYTFMVYRNCDQAETVYRHIRAAFPFTRFAGYAENNLRKIERMRSGESYQRCVA